MIPFLEGIRHAIYNLNKRIDLLLDLIKDMLGLDSSSILSLITILTDKDASTGILNTLLQKADKTEIPTNTSDLTNDSGYITVDDSGHLQINELNVTIISNSQFPNNWPQDGNINNLITTINNDPDATLGKTYLSTVSFNDLPPGLNLAEMKIEVIESSNFGKNLLFTITSEDILPYHWEYTSAYGRSGSWRAFISDDYNKQASENGLDTSLVTTGEKYLWNEKAGKDGKYQSLTAGNIVGYLDQEAEFVYRPSAGAENISNEAPSGLLKGIKGNTVVWNQLVDKTKFKASTTVSGITFTNNNNGSWSITGTADASDLNYYYIAHTYNQQIIDHVYYVSLKLSSNFVGQGWYSGIGSNGDRSYCNAQHPTVIVKALTNGNITFGITFDNSAGRVFSEKIYPIIIDLTLIYGSGNEPTTPELFLADYYTWFGKPLSYEDYDAGSLRPVKMNALKTVGFNQWDEEVSLNTALNINSNGASYNANGYFASTNYIKVISGSYYYIYGTSSSAQLFFYDSQYNYISRITGLGSRIFSVPENCSYVKFYDVGTTYNHDICINLSHSGIKDGQYEPYSEHTLNVPITTLKGKLNGEGSSIVVFPDGMKSVGTIYDEIVKENGVTKAIKRVGSADLGTLGWTKQTNVESVYGFYIPSDAFIPSDKRADYVECSKYAKSNLVIANIPDKTIGGVGASQGLCFIKDSDYTNMTAAEIAATLSGVTFYYALATPEEYILDDFDLPQEYIVDDWGTEEIIPVTGQVTVAPKLSLRYGINAPDTIRNLHSNYVSATQELNFTEGQKNRIALNIGTQRITLADKNNWNNKANIWRGTQAEYDLINTPDNNTIYIITPDLP